MMGDVYVKTMMIVEPVAYSDEGIKGLKRILNSPSSVKLVELSVLLLTDDGRGCDDCHKEISFWIQIYGVSFVVKNARIFLSPKRSKFS